MMKWPEQCYCRLLIDNHITDRLPQYMRKFDPENYARMAATAAVDSAMVYACDHNGNCYYPTRVGHMHANLDGRDIFGKTVAALRRNDIVPIAYYTVIYHNDSAARLPHTRVIDPLGNDHDGRYHYTCPNQPDARAFFESQLAEILAYNVAGIFIDMTFWPTICCCDGCRRKFGKPLPPVIDWDDPAWVAFQRFRESSMADFAAELTNFCRKVRPGITVTHQFSPVLHGWYLGQSSGIAAASDYAGGDFYGGKLQQRFAVKAFAAYTKHPPFEFMTSRCVDLHDHTSTKSPDELYLNALTTLANGGAYFFIDAIDPSGELHADFYRTLGAINARLTPFLEAVAGLCPRIHAEVGLYFSMSSCVDRSRNGIALKEFNGGRANNMEVRHNAVMDEVLGTSELLTRLHIPYKVLTDDTCDWSNLRAVIVNNAAYLSPDECARMRTFVRQGGTLIATGATSRYNPEGESDGNFALAELFGVDFSGKLSDFVTYTGSENILARGAAPLATARPGTEVLAYLTMPDFPTGDPVDYASIHSDPPGAPTPFAAITRHTYGDGVCVWMAAPIATLRQYTQQCYLEKWFTAWLPCFVAASRNLPGSVEITLLDAAEPTAHLLTLVNRQEELPVIPLRDVMLAVRLPFEPATVTRISDGAALPFRWAEGTLHLEIPVLAEGEFYLLKEAR